MIVSWDRERLTAIPFGRFRDLAAAILDEHPAVGRIVVHANYDTRLCRPVGTIEIKGGNVDAVQATVDDEHFTVKAYPEAA